MAMRLPCSRRLLALVMLLLASLWAAPAMAQNGISGAEAIDATQQLLQARGFTLPADSGLSYRDYITVHPATDVTATRVVLRIDAQGHLIPGQTWQNMHPVYCDGRSREVRKAEHVLRFKLIRWREQAGGKVRDQTTVFAGFIDADTNVITEQREAGGSQMWQSDSPAVFSLNNLSPDYVAKVMDAAWDALQFTGNGMAGPCGDKKEKPDDVIQPRDGSWRIELVSQSAQACPARIANGIKAAMGGTFGAGTVHKLDFAEPFHPEPLLGQGPAVDWQRTGKNSWHTVMNRTGGGAASVVVTVDAVVHSPTRIIEKQVFDMNGYFDCRSIATFELNWVATTASPTPPVD